MSETARVLGVVVCDLERTAIGTRSRLAERWGGERTIIETVLDRLSQVTGVGEVIALFPADQLERARTLLASSLARVMELTPRPPAQDARVRAGRAWNLLAWRGGAGQWTVFDEEYHPAGIASAAASAFGGQGAEHVLVVHSHGIFLDAAITSALVHHHLHKNHEMRVTYTPAAPGLSGMLLRADIIKEMGEKNVLPGTLLAYDVKAPTFDTLIREACMQVDPALSKIPNRFCVDTCRSDAICRELAGKAFASTAEMCLVAARAVAPGVTDLSRAHAWPREVEIELSARRLTHPPDDIPDTVRRARTELDAPHWTRWFARHADLAQRCDDLLVTLGGDGDPLLAPPGTLLAAASAARNAGALSICVQTDLAGGDMEGLLAAAAEGLIDVVSVTMYGHTAPTYAQVAAADLHATVMKNLERLAESARGSLPLVVPRLLKVRDTIPELEPFFDFWVERAGWAVIDYPTDRAGAVPFAAVVDMAPPKRRPCRRLWDRMLIRSDGTAAACDQDVHGKLAAGHIEQHTIDTLWQHLNTLRLQHVAGRWNDIDPCKSCREWHRA